MNILSSLQDNFNFSLAPPPPFVFLPTDPAKRIQFENIKELARDEDNDGTFTFRTFDVRRDEYKDRYEDYWGKRHFEMGAIAVSISGRSNM